MAIRNIVQVGDDVLRQKCFPVEEFDEKLLSLLDDMKDEFGLGETDPIYKNWIIKLPRNKFSDFRKEGNGYTIKRDNPDTTEVEGYTLLRPKVDGTNTYFDKPINNITKYIFIL